MFTKLSSKENMQIIKNNYLLHQNNYVKNKNKITLSELKNSIKSMKNNGLSVEGYYKQILLNNTHSWLFVNPYYCKSSFCNVWNVLQFLVLKRLFKQGYKLKPIKKSYDYGYKWEYVLRIVK